MLKQEYEVGLITILQGNIGKHHVHILISWFLNYVLISQRLYNKKGLETYQGYAPKSLSPLPYLQYHFPALL